MKLSSGGAVTSVPGAAVELTLIATIPVGDGPADIAIDPNGNLFALVVNEGSGTVTVIGFPTSLPPVPIEFTVSPASVNLGAGGRTITTFLEPPPPFLPEDIVISSVRLNGVVAPEAEANHSIDDYDGDGLPDLKLKFDRAAVQLVLPVATQVEVRVEGLIGTRAFVGTDTVKTRAGKVTHPLPGEIVNPLVSYTVRWETPSDLRVSRVAIVHSLDGGRTWSVDETRLPNQGSASWTPPNVLSDSVLVAIVELSTTPQDTVITEVVAVSEYFRISTPTAADGPPVRLEFTPIRPNPGVGVARLRFGLPERVRVDLELFDLQGRRLVTLLAGERDAGWHEVTWNGWTDAGGTAGAGLYFARLRAGGREFRQRLIWIR